MTAVWLLRCHSLHGLACVHLLRCLSLHGLTSIHLLRCLSLHGLAYIQLRLCLSLGWLACAIDRSLCLSLHDRLLHRHLRLRPADRLLCPRLLLSCRFNLLFFITIHACPGRQLFIQPGCLLGLCPHLCGLSLQCGKAGSCCSAILHLRSQIRILCDRFYRFHRLLRHHRHFRNFFLWLFLLCCGSRLIGAAHRYQNIIDRFLRLFHRYVCRSVFKERHIIFRLHNLRFSLCRMDAGNNLPHALCQLFLQLLCIKSCIRSCCSVLLLKSFFHCICGHHSRRSAGGVSPGLILYRFQNLLLCGCRMLAYRLGELLLGLRNDIFRDRIRLIGRHFIYNDLFQLRNGCLHPLLNGHHFISVVVNRLLHRC